MIGPGPCSFQSGIPGAMMLGIVRSSSRSSCKRHWDLPRAVLTRRGGLSRSDLRLTGWRHQVRSIVLLQTAKEWEERGGSGPPQSIKKPTWWNTLEVFHHVGLLVNEPPGTAELLFI